ncbi:MAG: zinc-ribbon domain-containing protein [Eubacterium sp.]|nr:zinc-ribbon domain-containing protein [Eubacterium sp.]
MFCRECGTENEDNAKFCRNCGLPIVPVEETIQPEVVKTEPPVEETVETPVTPIVEEPVQTQEDPFAEERAAAGYAQGTAPGGAQPYGTPGPQAAYVAQGNGSKPASASAIVSLILGIVSVVCCCTFFVGAGCGIAAICVAASDRKKNGSSGLTTAGLILGIVGVSLSVIYIIWFVTSGEFERLMNAIRTGRLQDYLNSIGQYRTYGF